MRRRVQIHERLFLGLGIIVSVALACVAGGWHPVLGCAAALTAAYAALLRWSESGSRSRLLAAYGVAWAFYAGSSALVEALGVPLRHQELLAADTWLFGQSPVLPLQGVLPPWTNDLLSLGYLSYHVYLHWALVDALLRDASWRTRLGECLFTAFALGFVGYLLWPAAPPDAAFSDRFAAPLAGGWLTHWNAQINTALAARYDAFPSLHALVTLVLLGWDWRAFRTRFWIMLPFSLLMLVATLALRLHYAVDLLAAVLLLIPIYFLYDRNRAATS